ncbi:MAG: ThiF family adenylyltransferase [Minisyncoccia bacterium]
MKINNFKPTIFKASSFDLVKFKKEYQPKEIIDNFKDQLEDYFLITHPKYKFIKDYQKDFEEFVKKYSKGQTIEDIGNWIYFPWSNTLIHVLEEKHFFQTKTARNIYLLTYEEQNKFYNAKIGIAGLSVGSHAALTLAMVGASKYMKIADNDVISLSNLNRIRYPLKSIGQNKALFAASQIYEMNPYANIKIYSDGLNEKNIEEFLLRPKIDVLVEEMDNLYLKIKIREIAKKHRIPVIMATDHGDNILVDIERYDLKPNYPILHGLLGKMSSKDFASVEKDNLVKLTAKLAGAELGNTRMFKSLFEVGKTIYSWPQLGNAATLCGAVLTYLAKKIILGQKLKEGRFLVDLENLLGFISQEEIKEKEKILKKFFSNV